MRAIDGKLPVAPDYKVISATYQSPAVAICDNCGLLIATEVTIEGHTIVNGVDSGISARYVVGADCAESLVTHAHQYPYKWFFEKSKLRVANQIKSGVAKLRKAERENRLQIKDNWAWIYDRSLDITGHEGAIWSIRYPMSGITYKTFKGGNV